MPGYPHSQRMQTGTTIGDALLHWKHCTSVLLLSSSDVQALPPPALPVPADRDTVEAQTSPCAEGQGCGKGGVHLQPICAQIV